MGFGKKGISLTQDQIRASAHNQLDAHFQDVMEKVDKKIDKKLEDFKKEVKEMIFNAKNF